MTMVLKNAVFLLLGLCLCTLFLVENIHADSQDFVVKDFALSELQPIGVQPIIVAAVQQANAMNKTLVNIQARDKKWRTTPGISLFMQAMLESKCALYLRKMKQAKGLYAEIFVMDNQGANVCMTDKTSDYWQGDEAKFQQSFRNGKGAIYVGDIEFDKSTHTYLMQVSVPVQDSGKVIGVITFGIDIEEID